MYVEFQSTEPLPWNKNHDIRWPCAIVQSVQNLEDLCHGTETMKSTRFVPWNREYKVHGTGTMLQTLWNPQDCAMVQKLRNPHDLSHVTETVKSTELNHATKSMISTGLVPWSTD